MRGIFIGGTKDGIGTPSGGEFSGRYGGKGKK
jgi:hypothetical protein